MPDWSKEIEARVAPLRLSPVREAEIVEELGQHLSDRYEELLAKGASEEEAHRSALEELSDNRTLAAELARALRPESVRTVHAAAGADEPGGWLSGIGRDLRHGARLLRLDPGFSIVAILSLALGIGANTAIFQLIDAVRLRTLPVQEPRRLAEIRIVGNTHGRTGGFTTRHSELTRPIFDRVRERQEGFSRIAAWSSQKLNLAPGGEARYAEALWVSGGFFEVLGVRPAAGRLLTDADDRRGCGTGGVVISDAFWQREFGGRAAAMGSRITLEGHPFEIVGVTPPGFFGVEVGQRFDVALPLCAEPIIQGEDARTDDTQQWWLAAVGRLKPGWTADRASAQLASISPAIFRATLPPQYDPEDRKHYLGFKLGAEPAASGWSSLRKRYSTPLWLLLGISGLVLMIACANLANLMVARASARQREIAVRLALGASRARLIRQLLAESVTLAAAGAVGGALLAQVLTRVLVSFLGRQSSGIFMDLSPDWRVFAFTTGLAGLTCLLFGLAPAIQASRAEPNEALKSGGRSIAGSRSRLGIRRALVISQVALSLVLLVGALLFVRTFRNLVGQDAGFRQDRILVAAIDVTPLRIPPAARTAYKQELIARLRAIPGVSAAGLARLVPASGSGWNDEVYLPGSRTKKLVANMNRVGTGFFRTFQTPFLAGRDFQETDTITSPAVAIVTQTLARKLFDGANPVGQSLTILQQDGGAGKTFQIVGLVRDNKYTDLREEFTPIVFFADAQDEKPSLYTHAVIRSDEPMAEVSAAVKRAVGEASPAIVLDLRVFQTSLRESLFREQLMATLSGFFGALAAILAMVGLYGVISYMVVRRRNEIGVRMALGASRGDILRMVMREAGVLLAAGLAIGIVLAVASASTARALLFGLKPGDPVTLAAAAAGLAAVAAAASLLPASRAARVDPMTALREE